MKKFFNLKYYKFYDESTYQIWSFALLASAKEDQFPDFMKTISTKRGERLGSDPN